MTDRTLIRKESFEEDAEQIIDAIRSGCVDAFVVEEHDGQSIYTLQSADLPYSALVQKMKQGAAMLNERGEVIYCNPSLAELLGLPADEIVGMPLRNFVYAEDQKSFDTLQAPLNEPEVRLCRADASLVSTRITLSRLSRDNSVTGVLVVDLTTEKENAELASRIQSVQDEERRGIARELHDSVGQLLAAMSMNLTRFRSESRNVPNMSLIDDSAVMLEEVSKEIRTISHLLHPPLLDVAGLASAVRWYVDGFSERSNIKVDLDIPSDCGRLSNEAEIAVFRVVQECLTNVYRHSGSDQCLVSMMKEPDHLKIDIQDKGHGIRQSKEGTERPNSGLGLRGMKERLRQLGGKLEIASSDEGTTITAVVPFKFNSTSNYPKSKAV